MINVANETKIIGLPLDGLAVKVASPMTLINAIQLEINTLLEKINTFINSETFSESELIESIPGIERLTAITLIAGIGNTHVFLKPKHFVAFSDIGSSVISQVILKAIIIKF